jgi:predicted 2-oxoglutarate/Fe(II)-dependent dioxygenase YbiX
MRSELIPEPRPLPAAMSAAPADDAKVLYFLWCGVLSFIDEKMVENINSPKAVNVKARAELCRMARFWSVRVPEPNREGLSFAELMKLAAVAGDGHVWTTAPDVELLSDSPPDISASHGAWPETVTLSGVLSAAECARIREHLESIPDGFGSGRAVASGPEAMRRNQVLVWIVPRVAASLWERIRPALRASIPSANGLNARLRCYRYRTGDEFRPHYDASQHSATLDASGERLGEDSTRRSRFSLLLYLNGGESPPEFEGGATALLPAGEGSPTRVLVAPQRGGALVFPHGEHPRSLLHAGEPVVSGTKYVIRTDVF